MALAYFSAKPSHLLFFLKRKSIKKNGHDPQTSFAEVKHRPLEDSAWMGDRSGRLNSTRVRVDHVASDHQWLWYLLYVKCLCVLSCDLSPVVEIWIILSGDVLYLR